MNINVVEKKETISYLGRKLFNHLTTLPREIRYNNQKHTGIHVFARIVGTKKRITVSVKKPSQSTKINVIENSVRTECHAQKTSQDHENNIFSESVGCISYYLGKEELHVSVGGLKPPENVLIAIVILSRIAGVSVDEVITDIKRDGGKLPEELFKQGHYLDELLNTYRN